MSAAPAASTSIAELRSTKEAGPVVIAGFGDSNSFALLQRMANALAQSTLVPQAYQGNLPNCIIALELAQRIGASPLMVAQNLYIVHGRPAWSSQFLIAAVNQCGRYTSLQYEWTGDEGKDSWTCRAFALDKRTGARVQGPAVSLKMAKDQGWYGRKDSKWPSMTELMMVYRAATYFARTNAPELTMGLQTADEVGDVIDANEVAPGKFEASTETLREPAGESPAPRKPRARREEPAPVDAAPAATGAEPDSPLAPPPVTLEAVLGYINSAQSREIANEAVDLARSLPPEQYAEACKAYNAKWAEVVG